MKEIEQISEIRTHCKTHQLLARIPSTNFARKFEKRRSSKLRIYATPNTIIAFKVKHNYKFTKRVNASIMKQPVKRQSF